MSHVFYIGLGGRSVDERFAVLGSLREVGVHIADMDVERQEILLLDANGERQTVGRRGSFDQSLIGTHQTHSVDQVFDQLDALQNSSVGFSNAFLSDAFDDLPSIPLLLINTLGVNAEPAFADPSLEGVKMAHPMWFSERWRERRAAYLKGRNKEALVADTGMTRKACAESCALASQLTELGNQYGILTLLA